MRIYIVIAFLLFAGNVSAQASDDWRYPYGRTSPPFYFPSHRNSVLLILHIHRFHNGGFPCNYDSRHFYGFERLYYSKLEVRKGKKFTYYLISRFQNEYNAGLALHPKGVDVNLSRKLNRITSRWIYEYMLRRLAIRSI